MPHLFFFLKPNNETMSRRNNGGTAEAKVADALLQTPFVVRLGGKEYEIAPPTVATLAMASREIAALPESATEADDDLAFKALGSAKDCERYVRVIAIFIIGAKAVREAENDRRKGLFGRKPEKPSPLDELYDELLYNASPRELITALSILLNQMQVGDFFAFTASLTKVNILAPMTAVTTQSGRLSRE